MGICAHMTMGTSIVLIGSLTCSNQKMSSNGEVSKQFNLNNLLHRNIYFSVKEYTGFVKGFLKPF